MKRRPISLTLVGWLFVVVGIAVLAYGIHRYSRDRHVHDLVVVAVSALVAAAGGALVLRGVSWGRWLLVAWLAFHVFLGAHHDLHSTVLHGLLFLVVTWLLFRRAASAWFKRD